MKYRVFFVVAGTVFALIHFLSSFWTAESVTLCVGALAVIVVVPMNEPGPIFCPGTLYSASCVISELVRIVLKNLFRSAAIFFAAAEAFHFVPQKMVKTSTFVISGPP